MSRYALLSVCLVVVAGCGKKKSTAPLIGGIGERVAAGLASDLRLSPDGQVLAYLKNVQKPRLEGVPDKLRVGELYVVPSTGGEPRKLGNGVSNFPGGYLFTPDSKWVLLLAGFNASNQVGQLQVAPVSGAEASQKLGSQVTYVLPSPDSKWIAFVDEGILKLGPFPSGPFRDVNGEVANAAFTPDATKLFFKRKQSAGGSLLVIDVQDAKKTAVKLADLVGEYRISDDGRQIAFGSKLSPSARGFRLYVADVKNLKDKELSEEMFNFRFSSDSQYLAWIAGPSPESGGEFFVGPADGSKPGQSLGTGVRDFAFSPDHKKVAFRQKFVPEGAEGYGDLMMAELPGGTAKVVGRRARSFEWAPNSQAIAFAFDAVKPIRSVNLYLWRVGETESVHIKDWVYDYDFTPGSDRILFRAECVREGRACNLLSTGTAKGQEAAVKKLVEGIYSFRLASDGQRVLFTYAQTKGDLYDTGVLNLATSEYKTLDQSIRLPPFWLKPDGSQVAYIIADSKRDGVYVASKVP